MVFWRTIPAARLSVLRLLIGSRRLSHGSTQNWWEVRAEQTRIQGWALGAHVHPWDGGTLFKIYIQ